MLLIPFTRRVLRRRMRKPIHEQTLRSPRVEHAHVENTLTSALTDRHCGVKVLWGPPGCGKSTYSKLVLHKLQQDGRGVVEVRIEGGIQGKYNAWLNRELGVMETLHMNDLFPTKSKAPVLFIDHADQLLAGGVEKELQSFVVQLAEQSVGRKGFTVLFNFTKSENAKEVLSWNGGEKIQDVFADPSGLHWHEDCTWGQIHLREFLTKSGVDWNDHEKDLFVRLGATAGTPGFALEMLRLRKNGKDLFHPAIAERAYAIGTQRVN